MKIFKIIAACFCISLVALSCKKYKEIGKSDAFPEQKIYIPAAVEGISSNGVYAINTVAVQDRAFRYVADVPNKKLNIPLAVYRAGIDSKGTVSVNVAVNPDTVARFITLGKLPAGTELLPADKYTLDNSVVINDGAETANFKLSVDLNFLLANLSKKYALGIGALINGKAASTASTVVVLIDPAFLVPTASFTTSINTRTVNFSNTSLNGSTYAWDYGDGTPLGTAKSASHTYAAAGTYTIKLTVFGALGDYNKVVYSSMVVIL